MAFALHSALALAIGQVVGAGVLLMVSVALVRPALNVSFARAEARELLSFSGQVSALNLSFFTLNTVPSWVTARFFGARVFGFYSRANVTVNLPLTYLATSFTKVLYPFYGRVRADTARTRVLLNEALLLTTGFTWPLFALIAGAAPVVVRALLGPGWDDASRLLSLCALAACANLPCVVLTNAAEAFGWMRVIWVRQLAYVAVLGAAIAIVVIGDLRLEWLLVGVAAAQWVTYLLTAGEFFQRGHLARETVLTSQAIHGAFALAAYAGAAACARILEDSSLGLQVVAEMSFGVVVVFILVRGRSWLPASSVLSRRLTQILPNKDRNILMRLAGMTSR